MYKIKDMNKATTSIITIEPTIDNTKKMLSIYNRMFEKSNDPTIQAY